MQTAERLPDLAVRNQDWKLRCEYDGTQPQLFNLAADLAETTNLANQQPELVARLTKTVLDWHKSMPPDNGPAITAGVPKEPGSKKKKNVK